MLDVVQERHARADLLDIWLYIASDNVQAADELIDRIEAIFATLAQQPRLGREHPELALGLRGFPIDSYVIYYRIMSTRLEIVRVLSSFRDAPRELRRD